jgi:predicted phage-related endonuclease
MLCHNLKRVHVVVLMGKNGLKRELYKVERNEAIIQAIIQKGEDFWNKYVVSKTPPPEDAFGLGSLDIIRRVQRVPQTWAEVPDELIDAWDNARVARLAAEKVEKEALSRILTPLGDAEGVQLRDGRVLTYYSTVKSILDQKKLKAECPEIYESMLKESISRTPRIQKGTAE